MGSRDHSPHDERIFLSFNDQLGQSANRKFWEKFQWDGEQDGQIKKDIQKGGVEVIDIIGAGYGIRTHDLQLGKLTLYR